MIIAMLNENGILDQSTISAKNVLSAQYSEETVQIFSEKIPFLLDKNGNLNLDSQTLPARLTFIGHSDILIYGKYNATEFANRLIAEINKASKIDPRMRTAIKVIDLLGCETGLVNAQGNSFAQIVSNRLNSAGFSIRVNALSNLTYKDHDSVEATILFNPDKFFFDDAQDTSIFVYGLLKSKSDRKQYYDLYAAKNSLYFQYEFKPVKRFF